MAVRRLLQPLGLSQHLLQDDGAAEGARLRSGELRELRRGRTPLNRRWRLRRPLLMERRVSCRGGQRWRLQRDDLGTVLLGPTLPPLHSLTPAAQQLLDLA